MKKIEGLSLQGLIGEIKRKKVLCFGLGIQGRRMADFFANWGVSERLMGYIDSDINKVGKDIVCGTYQYPVYSFEKACLLTESDILVLVTCLDYKTVYEKLDKVNGKNWSYIAIDEVAGQQLLISDYEEVVKEFSEPVIPKIIHYAWFGGEKPDKIEKNIEQWKKMCPDYEFFEWNEKNYDITVNQYMKQAYEQKVWGFVPDYMRLDIVYKFGGIYLDTDIEMIKRPDELLYQRCFGCIDASFVMNLGSGFGAAPGQEIIGKLRDYYDEVLFVREDGTIDKTSCNSHSLNVLKKYGVKVDDSLQNVNGMNIYPMVFQGACQYTKDIRITEKTFWIHHGNMSWLRL